AASLAAATALASAQVPRVEEDQIVRHEYERSLEIAEIPIYTTFAKIGKIIMVDPRLEEEYAMDARMSIATVDDGHVTAIQKGGSGPFTKGEISFMIDEAIKKGRELRKIVKEAVEHGRTH
ncbi:MAG: RNA-binding protein, partial [Candidatus Diapherotrites archaeon]|nr:RNA-binding protein [Candidatus Diapherotrites archaeon]